MDIREKFLVYPGNPEPLGLSIQGGLANFAIYSSHASKVVLGLRSAGKVQEIPLERTGDVWHAAVSGAEANTMDFHRSRNCGTSSEEAPNRHTILK